MHTKARSTLPGGKSAARTLGWLFALCLVCTLCVLGGALAEAAAPAVGALPDASRARRFTLESAIMGFPVPYIVWLPEGYSTAKAYPVWYGLHGYSSSETMWLDTAGIGNLADQMIQSQQITPLIMVFPLTRYDPAKVIAQDMQDGKRGETQMERFLCEELIPRIDASYATLATPENRYIGGFSMGGMFALQTALHHPTLFGKVGAYSPALTYQDFTDAHFDQWLFPWLASPVDTAAQSFAAAYPWDNLQVYLDCGGSSDVFSQGTKSLAGALQRRGVAVTLQTHTGGHSLQKDRLAGYLQFYCANP